MNWLTVPDNCVKLRSEFGTRLDFRIVFADPGLDIAYVIPTPDDNGNGHARLISAAPDLLEACKAMVSTMPTREPHHPLDQATHELRIQMAHQAVGMMRAAIKKAEGK